MAGILVRSLRSCNTASIARLENRLEGPLSCSIQRRGIQQGTKSTTKDIEKEGMIPTPSLKKETQIKDMFLARRRENETLKSEEAKTVEDGIKESAGTTHL